MPTFGDNSKELLETVKRLEEKVDALSLSAKEAVREEKRRDMLTLTIFASTMGISFFTIALSESSATYMIGGLVLFVLAFIIIFKGNNLIERAEKRNKKIWN